MNDPHAPHAVSSDTASGAFPRQNAPAAPDRVPDVDDGFVTAPTGALDILTSRPPQPRWLALFEALLVCGVPTQALVATTLLVVLKMSPGDGDRLSLPFFATLSLIDTLLVLTLIRFFLRSSGERIRDVFLGPRPPRREAWLGLAFVPVILIGAGTIVLALRALFPWMQNVPSNPFLHFMNTPLEAAVFVVVVVLAGGVREELQRAFILHRFEQRLGGVRVGLVLFTLTFAALHVDQGLDVAAAVGTLGFIWGVIYIRRRSVVFPIVNHAGFNALQVIQGALARAVGA
jgi:membrane protease YdiL (CAAX protease family)